MKLLLDQNISFRVAQGLQTIYTECHQVRQLNLENSTDKEIWSFAKYNNYAIVTFDADFYDMVTLYGHPPKVIWLRTGNTNTKNLISILSNKYLMIKSFLEDPNFIDIGCLEIE